MKISLIVSTIGSYTELQRLFKSLVDQIYDKVEVILIDQNKNERIRNILDNYRLYIQYHKSEKGLSKGRNVALNKIHGDIVAFPDDDCWYEKETLARVIEAFEDPDLDGITVKSVDENGKLSAGKESKSSLILDKENVWDYAISYTVFLRSEVINSVGYFDEELGIGAGTPWGSGEETDYLIRALNLGYKLKHIPKIKVCHPSTKADKKIDEKFIKRGMTYGRGMGRVLKKHDYNLKFVFYNFLKPFVGYVFSLLMYNLKKARYHKAVLIGRYKGWKES